MSIENEYNTENGKKHFCEVWDWMHSDEETRMPIDEKFKELKAKYGISRETCEEYITNRIYKIKRTSQRINNKLVKAGRQDRVNEIGNTISMFEEAFKDRQ